jgi:predicted DNA-binding transcriptional regulator YafY
MRRADRLLQIIQILRRENKPVTSASMAEELEVSQRTLYRDMASLESTGVPIRGEAGIGYVLDDGYMLPPLMFSESELEAIMLGARMVDGRVEDALSRSARDVVAKIQAIIPKPLRATLLETPLFAPQWIDFEHEIFDLAELRAAIRSEREVKIDYTDLQGSHSTRIIWPFSIGLFPSSRVITAWCTMRKDFRHFRTDKITRFEVLPTRIGKRRAILFAEWKKTPYAMTGDQKNRPNARIAGVGH